MTRARELELDHPSVHYSLAVIDYGVGRYERALEELDRALLLQPNHDDALQRRGRIYARWGQIDAAADSFRRAIDIRPGFWEHHRRLGLLYLEAGRYADVVLMAILASDYAAQKRGRSRKNRP